MKKIILTLVIVCSVFGAVAQKRVVLEKMRCLSTVGPVMNYLRDPSTRRAMAAQLSRSLTDNGLPALADTNELHGVEMPPRIPDLERGDITFSATDTSLLHLYIDFLEVTPAVFFSSVVNPTPDSSLPERARSVFLVRAYLFNHERQQLFAEELNVVATAGPAAGIGTYYRTRSGMLNVTPRGLTELFRVTTKMLFDLQNEHVLVEVKAAPAFIADDYILPQTLGQPRIFFTTRKNISSYNYNGKAEMIRMGDPRYEEIVIKGKNARKYPEALMNVIRSQPNNKASDFVLLQQDGRDVLRDKNYLLKLTVQIDPSNMHEEPYVFTNFLPGEMHCLLLNNDTIAQFFIQQEIVDATKKLYPAKVFNGTDTSFFTLSTPLQPIAVKYEYVLTGAIGKQAFSIKCSGGRNTVKEIFLGGKLVCIAQGKFNPEKIVVFDASLSPEILNPLLVIGFNRFLE